MCICKQGSDKHQDVPKCEITSWHLRRAAKKLHQGERLSVKFWEDGTKARPKKKSALSFLLCWGTSTESVRAALSFFFFSPFSSFFFSSEKYHLVFSVCFFFQGDNILGQGVSFCLRFLCDVGLLFRCVIC